MATQSWVSQVACHSRELAGLFWRLVRKWKVQSQRVHRDFRSSARDSLASETSSRKKHLEIFSKLLAWSILAGVSSDSLATYLSRENRMFCKMSSFSTLFSKRVLICLSCILRLFTFWSYFQLFKITVVISKILHHFVTILSIFKKRYGFCRLLFIFHWYYLFLVDFVFYLVFVYLLTVFWLFECLMFLFFCGFNLIHSILWPH